MLQISLPEIHARVLECLNTALEHIVERGLQRATTFGFWIDGCHSGCGVALNEDDDELFRCDEIASFTQPQFFRMWIPELDSLYRLPPGEAGKFASIAADGKETVHAGLESFCRRIHPLSVTWVKEWFKTTGAKRLFPCWIAVVENFVERVKIWRVAKQPLPAAPAEASQPVRIESITPLPEGMKVYRMVRGRQYTSLVLNFDPNGPRLNGHSLKGKVTAPLSVQKMGIEWRKDGGLSSLGSYSTFALRENHPAFAQTRAWLEPMAELIPAFDGNETWHLVNIPELVSSVLDTTASRCKVYGGEIDRVDYAEFHDDALRQLRHPLFQLQETPTAPPYFLERPGEESFVKFCARAGLRGGDWELIWCEDVAAVERSLDEFVTRMEARILRIEKECKVENLANYHCISPPQSWVWRIAQFRSIFMQQGIEEALRRFPGVGKLHIAAIRRKLPGQWEYENFPRPQGIESSLTKALQRRDMLLDLRGYLCCWLPIVMRELEVMEVRGSAG